MKNNFNKLFPRKINALVNNKPINLKIKVKDFNIVAGCVSLIDTELTEEFLTQSHQLNK